MQVDKRYEFDEFRLDSINESLWQGSREIRLAPKTFALLYYLIDQRGRPVSKTELIEKIWPGAVVSDASLTTSIRDLRRALNEDAKKPRYIETLHRRGYRFIGHLKNVSAPANSAQSAISPLLVGRSTELEELLPEYWSRALNAQRQLVFISGEPGIGKTTLLQNFLARIGNKEAFFYALGQCVELHGAGEAYQPLLEALTRLCRDSEHRCWLIETLQRYAPSWLEQLPALRDDTGQRRESPQTDAMHTQERMLRELVEAFDVISTRQPLLLVLEDLHWSDVSTLDWLSMLARRMEPARLLVLASYRPVDVIVSEHPLKQVKQELQLHSYCSELTLDYLTLEDTLRYLQKRFPQQPVTLEIAAMIHQRSGGNPLFMVNIVDDLSRTSTGTSQGIALWQTQIKAMPDTLKQLIDSQLDRLDEGLQQMLAVASVEGVSFTAALLANALKQDIEYVERQCDQLVRNGRFISAGELSQWPDQTLSNRYRFRHALYQEVLYQRLGAARQIRLHRALALRLEQAYADRSKEIAAELAEHFEHGYESARAIHYRLQAGENALGQSAHREAIVQLKAGLKLLPGLADGVQKLRQELQLQVMLGASLMTLEGPGAESVGQTYRRAYELCHQVGDTPELFPVLFGLWRHELMQARYANARDLAERCFDLARQTQNPELLLVARFALGTNLTMAGEFEEALLHLSHPLTDYDKPMQQTLLRHYGQDPAITNLGYAAECLWVTGYPDKALQMANQALALASVLPNPVSQTTAFSFLATVHLFRGEHEKVLEWIEQASTIARQQGYQQLSGFIRIIDELMLTYKGQNRIAEMRELLASRRRAGIRLGSLTFVVMIDAQLRAGQIEDGLETVSEALQLACSSGESNRLSELHRLKGQLLLQKQRLSPQQLLLSPSGLTDSAEVCFNQALAIARRQKARSFELRAAINLASLWFEQEKYEPIQSLLAPLYHWFSEGAGTMDLKAAEQLLQQTAVRLSDDACYESKIIQ